MSWNACISIPLPTLKSYYPKIGRGRKYKVFGIIARKGVGRWVTRKGGINFNAGYFLPTYEVIYLIPKPKFKLAPKANAYGDVWEFTQEMNNNHPAPFPVALIDRIICSTTAQTILDPFSGSGTTAIVALGLKRNFIGIELSPDYCKNSEKRIEHNKIQSELLKFKTKTLFQETE